MRVWEIDCQHLWRLRQATDDERNSRWFAARFHLGWLLKEETARQSWESVCGPIGSALSLVALQNREGRVPIAEIHRRHCRACSELGDWVGADADLARLRQISPGNLEIEKLQALAKTKKTHERAVTQCVRSLQPVGATPWSVVTGFGPRSGYFGE